MGLKLMLIQQGVVTAVGDGWFEWRQDGARSVQRIPFTSVQSFRVW